MGMYTAHDSAAVDHIIERHMSVLTGLCQAALGANLRSLVLAGSFGRGEGSVLIYSDGSVQPLRDYDVRAILHKPVAPSTIESIRREFMRVTGLGSADERFSGETGFSITLEPLTVRELASSFVRDRDLRAYDHLTASKLLWGEDYSASAALYFPARDIPKVNGLRFLYQKMLGLVGHFPGPGETIQASNGAGSPLAYECDKTFIEIGTALCLLADAYVPSYRMRAQLFAENYRRWFPELAEEQPDLGKQVLRATEEKLRPGSTAPMQPHVAFSEAREALLAVHRYYVRRLYGVDVTPSPANSDRLARVLRANYLIGPVSNWLSPKKLDNPPARWALNEAYGRMLRLKYARGVGEVSGLGTLGVLRSSEAPNISIYLAAWCALSAVLCRDGHVSGVDSVLLECAGVMLKRLPGGAGINSTIQTGISDAHWNLYKATREQIARAYHIWEHNR